MKVKSFEEASSALRKAIATNYADHLAKASAYLKAMYGTTIDDQYQLFALLIQQHHITICTETNDTATKIDEKDFTETVVPILREVIGWIKECLETNATTTDTAKFLWDKISLREGQDRTIALAILLEPIHGLVPYAQLPQPPAQQPESVYAELQNRPDQLEKMALLHRVFRSPLSTTQKALLIEQLLADPETNKFILLRALTEKASHRKAELRVFVQAAPGPESPPENQ